VSERETTGRRERVDTAAAPTTEESWLRHLDILDLLKQIRETRGRKRIREAPDRPR
jgi:hypothetical protein